jgi:hypothetical protein
MKDKRLWMILITIAFTLVILNSVAFAVDGGAIDFAEQYRRNSLRDLPGVRVLITDLNPEAERDGVVKEELQTDVTSRLIRAGIRVLTEEEWHKIARAPLLYVKVSALKGSDSAYAYHVNVELYQRVSIEQNPSTSLVAFAATWSAGSIGISDTPRLKGLVIGSLRDKIDEFIKAYSTFNPRWMGS